VLSPGDPADRELDQSLLGERLIDTVGQCHRQLPELISQHGQGIPVLIGCHFITWARTMLSPGCAVVIDCETTDLPGALGGKVGYPNLPNRWPNWAAPRAATHPFDPVIAPRKTARVRAAPTAATARTRYRGWLDRFRCCPEIA